jgi:hypothetical protein
MAVHDYIHTSWTAAQSINLPHFGIIIIIIKQDQPGLSLGGIFYRRRLLDETPLE